MRYLKLLLSLFFALLCNISVYGFEVDGIYYYSTSSTDLTVEVTYRGYSYDEYSDEYSGTVTIPSTVTYNSKTYRVTRIGREAFRGCSSLTSITIPEGVTSIGYSAFRGCRGLTSINIPEGVTSIGDYAFQYCSSLTAITIPESVTSIGDYAFQYCSSLTSINIPEGVTSIGDYAFQYCSSLTAITIPESVTSIGDYAFQYCSSLYKVINYSNLSLSKGSSSNGYVAYYAEVVYKGSDLTTVDDFQFYTSDGIHSLGTYMGNDAEIVLPDSYNGENYKIGNCAFYNCSSLTSITIPESVTSIGDDAFYGCSSLYSVTIGSGVQSIGSNAFSTPKKVIWLTNTPPTGYANAEGSINYVANNQYTSLNNVKVYPYLSSMFEVDGVKYVPVSPSERTCHAIDCAYDSTATAINVGETASFKGVAMKVTEVMPYTFYGNDHIEEVSVSHLGNIGDYAFCDCDSIETVDVSNQGAIGVQAFYNCDAIETVNVSNQGNIGSKAFYDCDGIKSVDIRNQESIGNQAFYGCNGMETANVTNKGAVGSEAFSRCSSLKTVTLGDSIGSLGDKAFYQCRNLQEIAIPDSVKSVGAYCFSGCSAMKSAVTGNGLTNIKEYTFESCAALVDVTVGDGVTTINNYAFQNCSSLPEITLPQTVTKVDDYVFAGCSKLADVIIEDRTTALALGSNGSSALFADCQLDSVYIGGKITYSTTSSKGYSPFYRNTSLRTVVITDREEQIYDNEFYGCTNLKSVAIGNGVKSIGDYAFSGCSSLNGFSFGSNMESIGAEAFSDCTNLTSITSHAAVPPTCGTQALDDINKWSCTLRVPSGYAAAYQAADQWKEFFFVEDVVEVEKYILTYVVDGEVYHTDTLVHKATIVLPEAPTKEGYTFSGWSEAPETMPAEDVTISGTFTVNKYLVTFKVGDEVIAADSLEYGATIVAPEAPEREGHTFNGWGEVAETVLAGDATYEGSYTVNIYKVYYYVGEELVHTAEVAYGEKIPEYIYEPTKEGDVLEGWRGEPYDTMPAHDVTYTANITNGIEQLTNAKGQLTIYDLNGRKIEVEDLRELLRGIYIVNGHRVLLGD